MDFSDVNIFGEAIQVKVDLTVDGVGGDALALWVGPAGAGDGHAVQHAGQAGQAQPVRRTDRTAPAHRGLVHIDGQPS